MMCTLMLTCSVLALCYIHKEVQGNYCNLTTRVNQTGTEIQKKKDVSMLKCVRNIDTLWRLIRIKIKIEIR